MSNVTNWSDVKIHVGDTIRVHYKLIEHEKIAGKTKREVKEETRERIQVFEGILLAIKGSSTNEMITVRHMGAGAIGVERIFPLVSPWIKKIEVKKHGDVRRAKLYYLRGRSGRAATRITESAPRPSVTV
ncbi:50S ribosomal protein L19 [Candidatus Gottesmanbacteria bacterium RIFCSPHIGHO2_01_FULL_46_14]|uniref:50S ribosomal protein L19 n=3 Tax=Candidatus Gottesmaniibacteriota TaxID=1752720 RepID=A0A1F5ZLY5_9BACT|nr:MAG: 50S ribosomal protein L19 [Candidatus Gottesmanbacteria bacterium GW2011_GWA1_47_8]OGG13117.1 MAG: 50S ribosomal protein L19 [Candidatus Gottesmanbacteria bacterium RIFCSPHIGHO2_01_FULL_46_14]OGG30069.1 MAG: 50S ribosomal protein L19 [Candidatus Gottesmanbacteria bacterium RIFCSPLOWO2_01_FULL_46_21]